MERARTKFYLTLSGLALIGAMSLLWVFVFEYFLVGPEGVDTPAIFILAAPLALCWMVYSLFSHAGLTGRIHLAVMIGVTVLTLASVWLFCGPRIRFVQTLKSTERGISEKDARRIMAGYLDAYLHETSDKFLPKELHNQGVTHCISYRWTNGQYNADIGQIFLKNGSVLGTRFLPD